MRKVLSVILFLLICIPIFSQPKQISDTTLEIWTLFTIGNFINDNAYRITSEKWPFKYKSMAGDSFDEVFEDTVKKHNEKLWESLQKIGYINPKKEFFEQLDSERNRIELASKLVFNDSLCIQLDKKLRIEKRSNYTKLIKISDNFYLFEISSFNPNDLSVAERLELNLKADLNNKNVIKQ